MENTVESLNNKITTLREEFQKENNFLNEVNKSIEGLLAKRKETEQKIHTINGAFQAYQDALSLLTKDNEDLIPEAISELS